MIDPPRPWPSPPVVRVTLQCSYCAFRFTRDFDRHDDFQPHLWKMHLPFDVANIHGTATKTVRRWWRTREVTEDIRVPIECPNCGNERCHALSRSPLPSQIQEVAS